MDRLDAMAVLIAVIEEGSISAGARRLRSPLATVSRKVADLERHIGTRLLIRTSRKVALTDAGRDYVAATRRILEQLEDAERRAAGEYSEPRGQLAVTASVVFGRRHVLPIALDFLAAHPRIDLRMMLVDRPVNLIEEHLDVAVRLGSLQDSSLMATRVGQVRWLICASPEYLARCGMPTTAADLAAHDGIAFENLSVAPQWADRGSQAGQIAAPRTRLAINTVEAAVDAAVAGLGIVRVLSYQVVDEFASGTLVPLLPDFWSDPVPVQLVYTGQDMLPVKVRAFLDWAVPRLRARLSALPGAGAPVTESAGRRGVG